jgi:hypothetical protein
MVDKGDGMTKVRVHMGDDVHEGELLFLVLFENDHQHAIYGELVDEIEVVEDE